MNLAIVGCGFVADYYLATAKLHPELVIVGIYDRIAERAASLGAAYGCPSMPRCRRCARTPVSRWS